VDFIHETTDSFNVLLILCRWGFGSHSELVLCFYDEKCLLLIIICSVICLNLLLDISTFSFFFWNFTFEEEEEAATFVWF
jgi:hypothetical protein